MKRIVLFLSVILLLPLNAGAVQTPPSFADLVEKLLPAVVNVSTTQKVKGVQLEGVPFPMFPPGSPFEEFNELFQQQQRGRKVEQKTTSLGSGFIIDSGGIIVTNNHVVADAEEVTVILHDNTKLQAKILGRDTKTDIAVLKVKSDKPLTAVEFGNSDNARVGDWVIAIGNPYGLGGTVTAGIVSARQRDINAGPFDDFIQTDAAINRGNSGGPMFNADGKVIGINTAIFSPQGGGSIGIGFAAPTSLIKPVVDQLIKTGKIKRGWLGVKIQTVTTEIAESLKLSDAKGALVLELTKKSPAEKAGIQVGDIITKFNGQEVANMKKLPRMVAETEVGKTVEVQLIRNNQSKTLNVTITELDEKSQEKPKKLEEQEDTGKLEPGSKEIQGMTIIGLTSELKDNYNIATDGVLVLGVDPKSQAAARGVSRGDVLVKANQQTLRSVEDFENAVKTAKAEKKKSMLVLLARENEVKFFPLPIE